MPGLSGRAPASTGAAPHARSRMAGARPTASRGGRDRHQRLLQRCAGHERKHEYRVQRHLLRLELLGQPDLVHARRHHLQGHRLLEFTNGHPNADANIREQFEPEREPELHTRPKLHRSNAAKRRLLEGRLRRPHPGGPNSIDRSIGGWTQVGIPGSTVTTDRSKSASPPPRTPASGCTPTTSAWSEPASRHRFGHRARASSSRAASVVGVVGRRHLRRRLGRAAQPSTH